ncbi:MAG: biopolymer transporter ExbD [Flavobacteriaceae bacterium]
MSFHLLAVTITAANQFYINSDRVSKKTLENRLVGVLTSSGTPSIVLRTEKKVAIDEVVYVMNIANKNGIKVVLAVESP